MVNSKPYTDAVKSIWCDRCTVSVIRNKSKDNSAFTRQEPVTLFENEPCRMSHKSVTIASDAENAARMFQQTVLILDNALDIPAGSKITVTHEGVTRHYERSGVPAVYSVHQEVPIALREDWT